MNDNLLILGGVALAAAIAFGSSGKVKSTTSINKGRGNPFTNGNQFSFRPKSVRVSKKSSSTKRKPSPRRSPGKGPSSRR